MKKVTLGALRNANKCFRVAPVAELGFSCLGLQRY